jgi:hypothetical protein
MQTIQAVHQMGHVAHDNPVHRNHTHIFT